MNHHNCAFAFIALVLSTGTARGHDFWVAPETFRPGADELIRVRLYVGDSESSARERARSSKSLKRFFVLDPSGSRKEVVGRDGKRPAGYLRLETEGVHVVAYESENSSISLKPKKFRELPPRRGPRESRRDSGRARRGRKTGLRVLRAVRQGPRPLRQRFGTRPRAGSATRTRLRGQSVLQETRGDDRGTHLVPGETARRSVDLPSKLGQLGERRSAV